MSARLLLPATPCLPRFALIRANAAQILAEKGFAVTAHCAYGSPPERKRYYGYLVHSGSQTMHDTLDSALANAANAFFSQPVTRSGRTLRRKDNFILEQYCRDLNLKIWATT